MEKVERFSQLCATGAPKTHIAFLGTAILARAVSRHADLIHIKPRHAPDNPNAFSARSLCHSVLVPLAAELGFSIGVTGREPLNNMPYFRIAWLGDGTPIAPSADTVFDYLLELVTELNDLHDVVQAREALHAFIEVRRRYQPSYVWRDGEIETSPDRLVDMVAELVERDSEGGRRAQAVVAGLMDIFAGSDRVESHRINDPSRRYPGDVCVLTSGDTAIVEKAIEVRDKPVTATDVHIFARKCIEMSVQEAVVVAVSRQQGPLDHASLTQWANELVIGLTVFHDWSGFVNQCLFWSQLPKPTAASRAVEAIRDRLIAVEAAPAAVTLWQELTGQG